MYGYQKLFAVALLLIPVAFTTAGCSTLAKQVTAPALDEAVTLCRQSLKTAQEQIYDPSVLSDWEARQEACGANAQSVDNAIKYVNEALQTTGDRFTRLWDQAATKRTTDQQNAQLFGAGIRFALVKNSSGKPLLDKKGLPAVVRDGAGYPLLSKIFENSPADRAGLRVGDALVAVDGISTKDKNIVEIVNLLAGKVGSSVRLTYSRAVEIKEVVLTRAAYADPSVKFRMLEGGIGYLRLEHFVEKDMPLKVADALNSLKLARAIIVDLRGNPGGSIANAVNSASLFLERGTVTSIRNRIPAEPVYQTTTIRLSEDKMIIETSNGKETQQASAIRPPYLTAGKTIVLLLDENSASASELFAAALAENGRAILVGVSTVGKGIGQSVLSMPSGTQLRVTSLRYFTPGGNWLGDAGQSVAKGIEPEYAFWSEQSDWLEDFGGSKDAVISFVDDLINGCHNYNP